MNSSSVYTVIAFAAWATATCGPVVSAIGFWRLANHVRPSWPIHLLFIPFTLLVEWASLWLLGVATGDDGYSPPGMGFALIPAFFLLILAFVTYFVVLAFNKIKRSRRGA